MTNEQIKYIDILTKDPVKVGHWLGFTKLNDLNGQWIKKFLLAKDDTTTLAHRGSYKTTCLSIAISKHLILFPNKNIIFLRKTDDDVVEIVGQVKKMLEGEVLRHFAYKIYGIDLKLLKSNGTEITTNLVSSSRGSVQLLGIGTKGSLTGKHGDWIITDDIVNLKDRISQAERKYIRQVYMELQNIKNRGGRITNTGTVWHKEDCISIMPNIEKFDCYSTGLMTREEIEAQRQSVTPSLFAANYELTHIASEEALFGTSPKFADKKYREENKIENADTLIHNGMVHIDASYGGADGTAMTCLKQSGEDIYVLGKIRHRHVDDCLDELLAIKNKYLCGSVDTESNADKGYLAKDIKRRGDKANVPYHESMNKYIKISTYLKKYWNKLVFLEDTDPEYINEIMDYTEDAEHDDCPDSLATLLRKIDKDKVKVYSKSQFKGLLG